MKTEIEVFALLAMGEIPPADRANLDPSEFFGYEDQVQAIKDDKTAGVVSLVMAAWPDIGWDGKTSLRFAVIERFKAICARNRGLAHLRVDEMHVDSARKILANHQANGGLSRSVVEQAEKVIAEFGKPVKG